MIYGLRNEFDEKLDRALREFKEDYDKNMKERDDRNNFLEEQLVKQGLDLEKSQQYQNRDTLKICGIKEPADLRSEDTDDTVVKFFEKASVPLDKQELSVTHRVPSREAGRSNVLVKLRSRTVRNSLMRKKKDMRENQQLKADYPDAFIVEHLTPLRSKVAY